MNDTKHVLKSRTIISSVLVIVITITSMLGSHLTLQQYVTNAGVIISSILVIIYRIKAKHSLVFKKQSVLTTNQNIPVERKTVDWISLAESILEVVKEFSNVHDNYKRV